MTSQKRDLNEISDDPPQNGEEHKEGEGLPEERADANVYHIPFGQEELPEDHDEKVRFTREYVRKLVPDIPDGVTYYLMQEQDGNGYVITIIVPNRLTSTVAAITASGLQPSFTEPEHPYMEDNALFIPSSFQVLRTGGLIDPMTASNNPPYLWELSSMLEEHIQNAPDEALDIDNWTDIQVEPDTGLAVISWTPGEQEQKEE